MLESAWSNSELLGGFADFYSDLSEYKLAIREGTLPHLLQDELPAGHTPDNLAAVVRLRLLRSLQRQQADVERGDLQIAKHVLRCGQYAMAALGDEVFLLEIDWPGAEHWLSNTLEDQIFGTRQAGRHFFVQIDQLSKMAAAPSALRDLAAIYLLALQLGFKGECRGPTGEATLTKYREQLIRLLGEPGNDSLEITGTQPFAQARSYTLSERGDRRLAPLKPWYRMFALAAALYLLLTSAWWFGYLVPTVNGLKTSLQ